MALPTAPAPLRAPTTAAAPPGRCAPAPGGGVAGGALPAAAHPVAPGLGEKSAPKAAPAAAIPRKQRRPTRKTRASRFRAAAAPACPVIGRRAAMRHVQHGDAPRPVPAARTTARPRAPAAENSSEPAAVHRVARAALGGRHHPAGLVAEQSQAARPTRSSRPAPPAK